MGDATNVSLLNAATVFTVCGKILSLAFKILSFSVKKGSQNPLKLSEKTEIHQWVVGMIGALKFKSLVQSGESLT